MFASKFIRLMISVFYIISVLFYCLIISRLAYVLLKPSANLHISAQTDAITLADLPFISIIICYRNEQTNLPSLLKSIYSLDYPIHLLQIILADDGSSDNSSAIAYQASFGFELCHIGGLQGFGGKKQAIGAAMQLARGSYIFCTDADCILPSGLLRHYGSLAKQTNAAMICGPVMFEASSTNLVAQMLQIEFASLIGVGAAAIGLGRPAMCNGANLFFSRNAFVEVGGYASDISYNSGDDVFLMQKISQFYKGGVHFILSQQTLVRTSAPSSMRQFYHQRLRWAGKFGGYSLASAAALGGIGVVGFYALMVCLPVFCIMGRVSWQIFFWFLIIKTASDYLFFCLFYRSIKFRFDGLAFLILQPIYPFYVLWFGLIGFFGFKYEWKGRKLN